MQPVYVAAAVAVAGLTTTGWRAHRRFRPVGTDGFLVAVAAYGTLRTGRPRTPPPVGPPSGLGRSVPGPFGVSSHTAACRRLEVYRICR